MTQAAAVLRSARARSACSAPEMHCTRAAAAVALRRTFFKYYSDSIATAIISNSFYRSSSNSGNILARFRLRCSFPTRNLGFHCLCPQLNCKLSRHLPLSVSVHKASSHALSTEDLWMADEKPERISDFEEFLQDKLLPDLQRAEATREVFVTELRSYDELRDLVLKLQKARSCPWALHTAHYYDRIHACHTFQRKARCIPCYQQQQFHIFLSSIYAG